MPPERDTARPTRMYINDINGESMEIELTQEGAIDTVEIATVNEFSQTWFYLDRAGVDTLIAKLIACRDAMKG